MVTKNKFNDKPTFYNLQRSLCPTESHTLIHNIREVSLPQVGCGLDKLEWTQVLNKNLPMFANTDIRVNIFLQKVKRNSNFDSALLAEEYTSDEETHKNVFNMATARKLAFEGMLQTPSKVDCNDHDTGLRAFQP